MVEACDAILSQVAALDAEPVPLLDAIGRVLAEDVRSPLALPPWDNASMDGYAVRAADVRGATPARPVILTVIGTVAAGGLAGREIDRGEAMRIMTGAPIPRGADSVVRIEDTDGGLESVRIFSDRDGERNVRPMGEDVAPGDTAVRHGEVLHAGHLGLIASVGRGSVSVVRRPRVAILASGDELVDVDRFDEVLAGRRIITSNSYSIAAATREAGGIPVSLGLAGDNREALRDRLRHIDTDLLITMGGVSVGAFDYTRSVIADLGGTQGFWRVRMRPGAPVSFGMLREKPWLGLPGNPVSALVTFELFARPAIRKMLGHALPFRRPVPVTLEEPITISAPLTHFLRARVARTVDGFTARLTGPQGSGLISSMAKANALLIVPRDRPRVERGETVPALLLRDDLGHDSLPPVD